MTVTVTIVEEVPSNGTLVVALGEDTVLALSAEPDLDFLAHALAGMSPGRQQESLRALALAKVIDPLYWVVRDTGAES